MSEPKGDRCFCPCHTNSDIVHVQSCCCHHGFKRGTCSSCDRRKRAIGTKQPKPTPKPNP